MLKHNEYEREECSNEHPNKIVYNQEKKFPRASVNDVKELACYS